MLDILLHFFAKTLVAQFYQEWRQWKNEVEYCVVSPSHEHHLFMEQTPRAPPYFKQLTPKLVII